MRYTIRFAHSRYIETIERFLKDPEHKLPEGVYRGLDVVVEAPDPEAALQRAAEQVGWPDHEISLVPMSINPAIEMQAFVERTRGTRAILDFWREHDIAHDPRLAASLGLETNKRMRRRA